MNFQQAIINDLRKIKDQCDRSVAQLSDEQLDWTPDPESNSIAIIMKHMAGNMLSRWTDFLTTDGEKPTRNRDGEFADKFATRSELLEFWEKGWACTFAAIEPLTEEDLSKTVFIRKEPHSVPLALVRQLYHYAQHSGQIIYIAKHLRGSEWKTLSVPRKR